MKEVHGTDPASLNAHLQSMKHTDGDNRFIVGGKPGTNQEIVMGNVGNGSKSASGASIINTTDLKNLSGNQFQIVMNGEPLQIIPVDHERGEITIDQDGRPIMTDGQPFEVRVAFCWTDKI